ncbi:MAG: acyltransferase domain-containing protein [Casimicrobiaceae bacterium]
MRWVALWSGQGGQRPEHVERMPLLPSDLRAAWEQALADAGSAVERLGNEHELTRNSVAQPTLCAWQLGAWRALTAALPPPALVAGYSVGEIAACAAAGGYTDADAIALAALRAKAMDAAVDFPAGLAAVVGLAAHEVAPLCVREGVEVAIRNGVRHFIVGGPVPALASFNAAALAAGAVRAQRLPVTTPAHTHWLAAASSAFATALQPCMAGALRLPMLSGIDARTLRSAAETAAALAQQISTPLDWLACMEAVVEAQPDAVLEIGPGNALARMLVEEAPGINVRALDDFRDPAAAISWATRQRRER